MKYRALIIDDEYRARRALRKICESYIPELEIVGEAEDVASGVKAIAKQRPDVLFLDIEMPVRDGFALLEEHVLPDMYIIFTTAHSEYAIRAMRLQAQDYLLKPIGIEDLEMAVKRLKEWHMAKENRDSEVAKREKPKLGGKVVALPTEEGLLLTDLREVMRCEGVGSYTIFHLQSGRQLIVTRNLKQFEDAYAELDFYRIHHRHLVNVPQIAEVNSKNNYLLMKNGEEVPMSQRKKTAFLKMLKDRF